MDVFDFIIVGGGASGCLLASRLSHSLQQLTVLLVDAGGDNTDEAQRSFGERHNTLMTPGYNWGYKTIPQEQLNRREIDYSRGKGLGGSTAINYCVYTRGPEADYEHWADVVGDDFWRWKSVLQRFKKIERFHKPDEDFDDFVRCSDASHGYHGEIDVGMTAKWDPSFGEFLDKTAEYYPRNYDHNSGDPIGIAVCQQTTHNGRRATASGAFLSQRPDNLHVMTDAAVTKVVFQGKKATAIEVNGKKISPGLVSARKEVILSAGAVDTPKLLLLSGVGPASDLQKLGIPVTQNLPAIGKNLRDRLFIELVTIQKPDSHHRSAYMGSPEQMAEARKQWATDQTGPLASYFMPQMIGFIRSDDILASEAFSKLSALNRSGLSGRTKPTYEIISQAPSPSVQAPSLYLSTAVAFHGTESGGEITLQSADPNDPPLINPDFLSHPFDRHIAIHAVRETLGFVHTPSLAKDQIRLAAGPKGDGDDDILDYVRNTATSMWHPCGTVKMGKAEDEGTCVDTSFKVVGLEGLRVVDMSVAPFLPR
ncbi:MAG: hypothetical protein LQ345_004335 [Seirophora villosa]|nr:MAG: hypothetical protein LQ345_004335 [Seirophora villosa]